MVIKNTLIKFSICLFIILAAFHQAEATNLRGRIVRFDPQSGNIFPLGNVRVDLWINNGSQWVAIGYAFTDANGFYFFYNVAPGYPFQIQVFGNFMLQYPPTVVIVSPPYFQDIPQISA